MTEEAPLYTELAEAPDNGEAFWLPIPRGAVRAAVWPGGTRGTIILLNGRTEYIEKYGRVVRALTERGFAVATLDWRGQGLSRRPLEDPMKGHVGDFSRYQRDVRALMDAPQVRALPEPHVLVCHSMGGCIGLRALLEENVRPAATVMSAPMLGIHMKPHMRFAANAMVAMARRFGFETAMAPAPQKGAAYVLWQAFEGNALTGDEEHYEWMRKHLEAEPGFALGSPTLGWMGRAFDEMESLSLAPPPETPMLIFLGDDEEVVEPAAIRAFDDRTPNCRLVEIAAARHEVLMETPAVRRVVWDEFDRFLGDCGV